MSPEGTAEGSQWQANAEFAQPLGKHPEKFRSPVRAAEVPASLQDADIFLEPSQWPRAPRLPLATFFRPFGTRRVILRDVGN